MLEGVHKVLKPEGTFISITFGQVERYLISVLPHFISLCDLFLSAAALAPAILRSPRINVVC